MTQEQESAEIERTVSELLAAVDGKLPGEQLGQMRDLAAAGESGVALENLCTQLHEYDAAVSPEIVQRLRTAGLTLRIAPKYWERLI